jgi:DICT domain-containing protein
MWESRYGFPPGSRSERRRRLYGEGDVESVLLVQRLRADGLTMGAAIAEVGRRRRARPSVFATLRERFPDLSPIELPKSALLTLTHAVEDEHAARAGDGLLIASFQEERHYRAGERRWRELSRTPGCSVVLADFATLREAPDGPVEVPVPPTHELGREWTLIADSAGAQACVSAWELPVARALPDMRRRFEVLWSFTPAVVEAASASARSLIESLAPALGQRLAREVPTRSGGSTASQERFASNLASRAYAYLATRLDG